MRSFFSFYQIRTVQSTNFIYFKKVSMAFHLRCRSMSVSLSVCESPQLPCFPQMCDKQIFQCNYSLQASIIVCLTCKSCDCNSFVSVAIIGVYFVLQLAKGWINYYEWQNNPCALVVINKRQSICFGCNSRCLFCVTCNKQNLLSLNLRPGLTRPINKTSTKWAPETERWKYQNWILWRNEKSAIVLFKGINYNDLFP